MNAEQVKSLIRSTILFISGIVGGVGVAWGWYSPEQLTSFLSSEQFLSLASIITFFVTSAYGLWMNTQKSLVTATAAVVTGEGVTVTPAIANAVDKVAEKIVVEKKKGKTK